MGQSCVKHQLPEQQCSQRLYDPYEKMLFSACRAGLEACAAHEERHPGLPQKARCLVSATRPRKQNLRAGQSTTKIVRKAVDPPATIFLGLARRYKDWPPL